MTAQLVCLCKPPRRSFGVLDRMLDAELDGVPLLIHYDCQPDDVKAIIGDQIEKQFPEIIADVVASTSFVEHPCKCGEPGQYGVHRPTGCEAF